MLTILMIVIQFMLTIFCFWLINRVFGSISISKYKEDIARLTSQRDLYYLKSEQAYNEGLEAAARFLDLISKDCLAVQETNCGYESSLYSNSASDIRKLKMKVTSPTS